MTRFHTLATSVLSAALFSSPGAAQDLSKYRGFEFGMSIESVAKQAQINPADAKIIHQRPEVIQTLDWQQRGYFQPAENGDSLRNMRFDFYNGALSKMVMTYDAVQTEGLTANDLIEAISVLYGPATSPEANVVVSASSANEDSEKVLARWENAQYSYNLFRSFYGTSFGVVAFSKRLDLMARTSSQEADRLDKLEAPARDSERLKKQEADRQAAQEKARLVSKPRFKP